MSRASRTFAYVIGLLAIASVVACAAGPDGDEHTGTASEAATCETCSPGTGSGSSSGGGEPGVCNPATSCCITGSATLAAIDALIGTATSKPSSCGAAFAAAGCGIVVDNLSTHFQQVVSVGYQTTRLPAVGVTSTGQDWYQMVCPTGSFQWTGSGSVAFPIYPTGCVTADFPNAPPSSVGNCSMPLPAGYFYVNIDPVGCTGSACARTQ
jgi:hypothetical protein